MNSEEYLKQELSIRELWNTETDDCYQVLAEIMNDYAQSHTTKLEARNKELEEALEKIKSISKDEGRSGCTYNDTEYNSEDVVYGYNLALDYAQEIAEQALNKKP